MEQWPWRGKVVMASRGEGQLGAGLVAVGRAELIPPGTIPFLLALIPLPCLLVALMHQGGAHCSQGRGAGKLGDRGRASRHPALPGCRVSIGSPPDCGVLLFIASKSNARGVGFSAVVSPSPHFWLRWPSGTQCASQGTFMLASFAS